MIGKLKTIKLIVGQLNYIMTKKQKRTCAWVFLSMILCSLLELIGVTAVYPFIDVLMDLEHFKEKDYLTFIYRINPDISSDTVIAMIGVFIVLVYVFKNLVMIASAYLQNCFAARVEKELSTHMLKAYLKRPYEFFLNHNSSIVLRGITTDIQGVYKMLVGIFELLASTITVVVLGTFLLISDFGMAIGALLLCGTCFFIVFVSFKEKIKKAGKDIRTAVSYRFQYAGQAVAGIKEIMVANRVDNFVKQYEKAAIVNEKATMINGFLNACPKRILEGVCIGGFVILVCGKMIWGTNQEKFIPMLAMFAMSAFKILPAISAVSGQLATIIFYREHLQEAYDNLKISKNYENKSILCCKNYENQDNNEIIFENNLNLTNITWKYKDSPSNILEGLSLEIKKGESIALIGESGCGKTTLADIIMGLLMPQEGNVKLDGKDIFSIRNQWSKIIGYVPQSVFLIDDTIRNNIAFGLDEETIDDKRIWAALEKAKLKEHVISLPNGIDTILGERGVKFSGGQRQRIAIARALYEEPSILVFDEATSALDQDTEEAVMQSINALQGKITLIIVAHRLTTIRECDKIYEIKNGKALLRIKEELNL